MEPPSPRRRTPSFVLSKKSWSKFGWSTMLQVVVSVLAEVALVVAPEVVLEPEVLPSRVVGSILPLVRSIGAEDDVRRIVPEAEDLAHAVV
jgi:hypothetical protein